MKTSAGWYVRLPTLIELFGNRGTILGSPDLLSRTRTVGRRRRGVGAAARARRIRSDPRRGERVRHAQSRHDRVRELERLVARAMNSRTRRRTAASSSHRSVRAHDLADRELHASRHAADQRGRELRGQGSCRASRGTLLRPRRRRARACSDANVAVVRHELAVRDVPRPGKPHAPYRRGSRRNRRSRRARRWRVRVSSPSRTSRHAHRASPARSAPAPISPRPRTALADVAGFPLRDARCTCPSIGVTDVRSMFFLSLLCACSRSTRAHTRRRTRVPTRRRPMPHVAVARACRRRRLRLAGRRGAVTKVDVAT